MPAAMYLTENGDVYASPRRTLVITPADTEMDFCTRWIRANTAGVIKVTNFDGTTCLCNFLAGETRYLCVRQIWATGTTVVGVIEAGF